jgi:bifunctional UDP-N-acetylglucosamine pyrophosphorylase / glucosamine-1-phosphate N-acetyltransferase
MDNKKIAAVVLAAGKGTRMHSSRPKVLQQLLGEPLLWYVHEAVSRVCGQVFVVTGHCAEEVERTELRPMPQFVRQSEQLGTGHALQTAWPSIGGYEWCLVVNGDTPLITPEDLRTLIDKGLSADLAFLTMRLPEPGGYGRIVRNRKGDIERIVESKDFDPANHGAPTGEVNAGHYLLNVNKVGGLLSLLDNCNRQKELYITQLVDLAIARGLIVEGIEGKGPNLLGVNSPNELVQAEETLRQNIVSAWSAKGALIRNPGAVRIGPRAVLEPGSEVTGPCEIYGHSRVESGARIESHTWVMATILQGGTQVRSFSHLDGAHVGPNCVVGPYARLRPGTILKEDARIGNFVEVKKCVIGQGSKANHLTYLGDSEIGENVNIGAGTVTCNYDGKLKHKTVIGDEAFIGSNTALVAPVSIGGRSIIGAGSTITKDVGEDILAVARSKQKQYPRRG